MSQLPEPHMLAVVVSSLTKEFPDLPAGRAHTVATQCFAELELAASTERLPTSNGDATDVVTRMARRRLQRERPAVGASRPVALLRLARPWVPLAVGVVAGLLMLRSAHDLAHVPVITGRQWTSPGHRLKVDHRIEHDLVVWWLLFLLAALALVRAPRRAAVGCALAIGVAVPVVALAHRAPLSNDLYRYSWDGRVQAHGIDPYRYAPADPALASLRTRWLWPGPATCASLGRPPGCWRINRLVQRTAYPPVAEGWFTAVAAILPAGSEDVGWEVAGFAVDLAVTAMLLVALRRSGSDLRQVAWWTCCPLVAVEAVQNAHVDTVAALAVAAGVLYARQRSNLKAGVLAGLAIGTKLYPVLLLPALVRRRAVAGVAVASGVVALAYLPHVLAVGPHVLGYLPGYLKEEGYSAGTRFLILDGLGVPPHAAAAVGAGILAVVVAATWRYVRDPALAGGITLVTAFLVATPAQPWYALTLIPLAVLARRPEWLAVAAASYPLYLNLLVGSHPQGWGFASFGAAATICVVAAGVRWVRRARTSAPDREAVPVAA